MILQITNDFSGSTVYKNLVGELDELGIEQIVYNPIKDVSRIDKNKIDFNKSNSKIIYSHILNKYTDRIFYKKKIDKIVRDIESKVDLSKITFIHAHTWYSDGGVAYELHKKYNIPYIVAIRNTDLNIFLKYFIHYRNYGQKILINANTIVTISAIYKKRILADIRLKNCINTIKNKLITIPNGVDSFWIENKVLNRKPTKDDLNIKLLYIGKFDSGKNVVNLIDAVQKLNSNLSLTLVGGEGNDQVIIENKIKEDKNINYVGKVFEKKELLKLYQNHDFFVMPSKNETFGLVYVEALLQGLPILYTKNEGIDGFYNDNIGEKVKTCDSDEISKTLFKLIHNKSIDFDTFLFAENHNWKLIAIQYSNLYKNLT